VCKNKKNQYFFEFRGGNAPLPPPPNDVSDKNLKRSKQGIKLRTCACIKLAHDCSSFQMKIHMRKFSCKSDIIPTLWMPAAFELHVFVSCSMTWEEQCKFKCKYKCSLNIYDTPIMMQSSNIFTPPLGVKSPQFRNETPPSQWNLFFFKFL